VSPSPLLELRNVTKHFGAVRALDGVSLSLFNGEVLGLLGDNGAGKSTLIKAIAGVHRLTAGEILFRGKPVEMSSPAIAHKLGIETVFQDLALIPNLRVADNFFIGRELGWNLCGRFLRVMHLRAMEEDARRTLAQLDIHIPSLRVAIESLSGGQRQAVAIARALRWEANIVILDEPTAALSVPEQKKVLELTRQLAKRGVAVIYITHNILDVLEVTDRLVVLYRGRKAGELVTGETNEHEIVSTIMGANKNTRSVPPPSARQRETFG
jgi:ABC-type sugar transport system ATPase subunit